jgi:hypothetical protein
MNQQQEMVVRWVLTALSAAAVGNKLIPPEWGSWLASPDTIAVLSAAVGFAVLVRGWIKTSPPKVVKSAANIVAKDGGAVIASPVMADVKLANVPNVVSSVEDATNVVNLRKAA